jgi:hypothetical protein
MPTLAPVAVVALSREWISLALTPIKDDSAAPLVESGLSSELFGTSHPLGIEIVDCRLN